MRKRLYEIIEVAKENDRWSQMYDFFMIFMIFISLAPLTVKEQTAFLNLVDKTTAFIFIIDYCFRFITADFKLKKGIWSFIRYPFTIMAIVDLVPAVKGLTGCAKCMQNVCNCGQRLRKAPFYAVFRDFKKFKSGHQQ